MVENTHTRTDGHEGETLILIRKGPLQGEHVQRRLRDLVRRYWHNGITFRQFQRTNRRGAYVEGQY